MEGFFDSNTYTYVIIPLVIVLAKIADVTLGTIRIIVVARGNKFLAPILGFFEVLIWVLTIGLVMSNLNNWLNYLFYALGFAIGNYIGILLEEKLAMGNVMVHIITKKKAGDLIRILKANKYRITHFRANSDKEEVSIIYVLIKRKNLDNLINRIKKSHPRAFFSIEDVRFVSEGMMPLHHSPERRNRTNFLKISRHGK
ncbi:DUF2179 domain-containing protein [Candidatus Peregrinibacteria bacterium]|nr:DUF2179 domain-containing protein [Candidatus Peregrinibacteria bacterium]